MKEYIMKEGFYLDRDNFLHREATTGKGGKLVAIFNGIETRVKDKTELVKNTALEMEDGTWLINDSGPRRSGLWLVADEPLAEANMHLLYDGVQCGPIRRAQVPAKEDEICWEFCDETEATHYLLKERWEKNSEDPLKDKEKILEKYDKTTDYIRCTSSKAENTGSIWVIKKADSLSEDLFL